MFPHTPTEGRHKAFFARHKIVEVNASASLLAYERIFNLSESFCAYMRYLCLFIWHFCLFTRHLRLSVKKNACLRCIVAHFLFMCLWGTFCLEILRGEAQPQFVTCIEGSSTGNHSEVQNLDISKNIEGSSTIFSQLLEACANV